MKKSARIEEKVETKVKPIKENNSALYIVAIILLLVFFAGYFSLKQHDFEKKYSALCSEKLVNKYWENYSLVTFNTFYSWYNDTFMFYWYYTSNWITKDIDCFVDSNDNVEFYIDSDSDDLKQWEVFYEENLFDTNSYDLDYMDARLDACEERAWTLLNYNEWEFKWNDETLQDNTFTRTGHVSYLKWWEHAEDDVECSVDIKEKTVDVKFSNHMYNWELQIIDDIDLE